MPSDLKLNTFAIPHGPIPHPNDLNALKEMKCLILKLLAVLSSDELITKNGKSVMCCNIIKDIADHS